MTLFSVIFIGAGVVHAIEDINNGSFYTGTDLKFDFLAFFYFLIVTSSTLGYGDIFPIKTLSRMVSVVIILVMVYIIGDQLSRISMLMSNYSKYDTSYQLVNHIVIVGGYRPISLYRFLTQFYHPDHGMVKTRCIIVG